MSARAVVRRLGVASIALGFAASVVGEGVPADVSYDVVVGLAGATVLLGGGILLASGSVEGERWRPTTAERGHRVPVPGDDLADTPRRTVKRRLRRRVVVSLIDALDCSRTEAEEHVAAGTWTDDRIAASYLGREAPRPPPWTRLLGWLRGEPREERARRHAVAALRRLREGDG